MLTDWKLSNQIRIAHGSSYLEMFWKLIILKMWAETIKTLKNTSEKRYFNNVATLITKWTSILEFFKELFIIIQTLTFQSTSKRLILNVEAHDVWLIMVLLEIDSYTVHFLLKVILFHNRVTETDVIYILTSVFIQFFPALDLKQVAIQFSSWVYFLNIYCSTDNRCQLDRIS